MKIAILGANSTIAKDLVVSFSQKTAHKLQLFCRQPAELQMWLAERNINSNYQINNYEGFAKGEYEAIINFVGSGDPAKTQLMGSQILDITYYYDNMALNYLQTHKKCHYIFISSGAVFGANAFDKPVDEHSQSVIDINNIQPHDYYGIAKLYAEIRHRAMPDYAIVDVRVFNYFSPTVDINSRFLITDILRALKSNEIFTTSPDNIYRDYIGQEDFYNIISLLLQSYRNMALDCYSVIPIGKLGLLKYMQENHGLKVTFIKSIVNTSGTGYKINYYSNNKRLLSMGYQPKYSSLEMLMINANIMINGSQKS